MCGLAGILCFDPDATVTERELEPMVAALAPRGPDGTGFHTEPGIGLGHARLSIIDLETGHQGPVGGVLDEHGRTSAAGLGPLDAGLADHPVGQQPGDDRGDRLLRQAGVASQRRTRRGAPSTQGLDDQPGVRLAQRPRPPDVAHEPQRTAVARARLRFV